MRTPVVRGRPANLSTIRDLLLVVIGCNMLVFLALAHLSRSTVVLVGMVAIALLVIGVYGTARELTTRA